MSRKGKGEGGMVRQPPPPPPLQGRLLEEGPRLGLGEPYRGGRDGQMDDTLAL